jgi:hypothetical protein
MGGDIAMNGDWFTQARDRLAQRYIDVLCDTQSLVEQHGAQRLGDIVRLMKPPTFIPDAQQGLDDFRAGEILREFPELWAK